MNNKDIIAKIKAEIERRVDILATVSVKQAKDGDSEMSTYYHGKAVSLEELISFLSTLEPEKPMVQEGLEKGINRTYHDGSVTDTSDLDHVSYENIASHFAQWGADHIPLHEDTVLFNKGVEEGKRLAEEEQADLFTIVALDAAQRAKEQMMKDGLDAVKSGQSNKIEKTIAGVFVKYGMDRQKELMMKEAVEGEVMLNPYPTICLDDCKDYEFKDGQKVRIIIVKEEENGQSD